MAIKAPRGNRSCAELQHALRVWVRRNRRHHESQRTTLVRVLTIALDCPKNSSGLPTSVASPGALRQSAAMAAQRSPNEAFATSLRTSALAVVTPKAPDIYADDLDRVPPASAAWEATRRSILSGAQDAESAGESEDELTHAERWAEKRHAQIERATALQSHHAATFRDTFDSAQLRSWHPDQGVTQRVSTAEFGAPPPKRGDVWSELGYERQAVRDREQLQKLLPERRGIQGVCALLLFC